MSLSWAPNSKNPKLQYVVLSQAPTLINKHTKPGGENKDFWSTKRRKAFITHHETKSLDASFSLSFIQMLIAILAARVALLLEFILVLPKVNKPLHFSNSLLLQRQKFLLRGDGKNSVSWQRKVKLLWKNSFLFVLGCFCFWGFFWGVLFGGVFVFTLLHYYYCIYTIVRIDGEEGVIGFPLTWINWPVITRKCDKGLYFTYAQIQLLQNLHEEPWLHYFFKSKNFIQASVNNYSLKICTWFFPVLFSQGEKQFWVSELFRHRCFAFLKGKEEIYPCFNESRQTFSYNEKMLS